MDLNIHATIKKFTLINILGSIPHQKISTFTQYMSASHGYSTMGGIEYDDGGCVEKKKEKVSH